MSAMPAIEPVGDPEPADDPVTPPAEEPADDPADLPPIEDDPFGSNQDDSLRMWKLASRKTASGWRR